MRRRANQAGKYGPVQFSEYNIASFYQSRMERNYAATGQGFGEDSLIDGDLDLCRLIIEK